jgi:hypothetical protein
MKLKSLKLVLPILLILPSFAFADWHYWRTPTGTGIKINSPPALHFDWTDWNTDVCDGDPICINRGVYWAFYLKGETPLGETIFCGYWHDKTEKEITEIADYLDVGTKIREIKLFVIYDEERFEIITRTFEENQDPYLFEIVETPETIGNTPTWLSSYEILSYIGKLAEDIPDYIALMIGLPIAFWFIEKTIAFVRGNFRPAEKIKEE